MAVTALDGGVQERSWTSPVGCGLYRELSATAGNLVFSPYGIVGALMVARAGAGGATRTAIEGLLGRPDEERPLTESFGRLMRHVGRTAREESGLVELITANALWCQSGWPVRHEYVETLRARLGAEVGAVDFAAPELVARTMNAWAAEATRGHIRALVDSAQVRPGTRMLLSNAVYFKAPWLEPFEERHTWPEAFHLPGGRRVDVAMMHRTGRYDHVRTRHGQVLELPYVIWPIRMFVLLPDEGRLREAESDLRPGFVRQVARDARPRQTHLSLPVCRLQHSLPLRGALERLGLGRAFTPQAEFPGISEKAGLSLDDILHRSVLDIEETAAVARAAQRERPVPGRLGEPLEFRVDRPYLVFIGDTETETLFLVGRITDPRG